MDTLKVELKFSLKSENMVLSLLSLTSKEHCNFHSSKITKEVYTLSNLGLYQRKKSIGKVSMFYQIYSVLTISCYLDWPLP